MKGRMYERMKGKIDTWMQEGREERKDEKKKGSIPQVSEKGPNNQTSTPESTKKGCRNRPKWCQNQPKRVPKRSQDRQKIRATSSRRSWTPLGGDFPAIAPQLGSLLESKIEAKIVKKLMQKIVDFLIGLGSEKIRKRIPKPLQNGAQDGPKSSPEGSSRGKWEKCKNEQHYKVLARFLLPQGVENRRKNR